MPSAYVDIDSRSWNLSGMGVWTTSPAGTLQLPSSLCESQSWSCLGSSGTFLHGRCGSELKDTKINGSEVTPELSYWRKEDRTVMMIESVGRASYSNCSTVWRCGIDGGKDDIQISIATITANLHSWYLPSLKRWECFYIHNFITMTTVCLLVIKSQK